MNAATVSKFREAVDAAEIKNFALITDLPTYLYQNEENSMLFFDDGEEMVYCIRDNSNFGYAEYFEKQPFVIMGAKYEDVHEVRTAGTLDQVKDFIDAMGFEVTEEVSKKITAIAGARTPFTPITGDYNTFKELTEEEVEALTPEKREQYEKELLEYNKRKWGMTKRGIVVH